MPEARRRTLKTGGVKKGSRHLDDITRAAAVASFEAGMSNKDIEEKFGGGKAQVEGVRHQLPRTVILLSPFCGVGTQHLKRLPICLESERCRLGLYAAESVSSLT